MAVLTAAAGSSLSLAQTGNADSTNTLNRSPDVKGRGIGRPAAVVITSAIGATPTVTVNILGSVDGVNFYNIPYALVATPSTFVVAAITITTAVTTTYLLQVDQAWSQLKLNYSANTNVTLTADAYL